jgi:hypothetical protein
MTTLKHAFSGCTISSFWSGFLSPNLLSTPPFQKLQQCEVYHFPSATKGLKEYEVREDEDGDPKGNEDLRLRVHHSRSPARVGKIPANLGDYSQVGWGCETGPLLLIGQLCEMFDQCPYLRQVGILWSPPCR